MGSNPITSILSMKFKILTRSHLSLFSKNHYLPLSVSRNLTVVGRNSPATKQLEDFKILCSNYYFDPIVGKFLTFVPELGI